MKRWILGAIAVALCLAVPALGESPVPLSDHAELKKMYENDQSDRSPGPDGIDWAVVGERDERRRTRTLELLREGAVRTSGDYLHAAFVFQHGESVEDARLALSLAWISATIDPENDTARWLTAAAWDRLMMRQDQPQWYGTQFTRPPGESEWRLYKIAEDAVTDEERTALGVRTLEESKARVKKMNE